MPAAAKAAALCLLCLLVVVVPGSAILTVPPSHTIAAAAASDREDPDDDGDAVTPSPVVLGERILRSMPSMGPVTYVPILLYHYIRINPNPSDRVGFSLSTSPTLFGRQMQYLADNGFHVISLHQAVVAIQRHSPLPARPVVLTFDDGYADFLNTAVPILQHYGFTATDFVITGRMGRPGFMTPTQVVVANNLGFTIGAHTVNHVALASCSPACAGWEMRQSKATLESLLGHPVLDFAYPYGSFNAYDMNQARSLGFETAVSTLSGTWHAASQLFDLSRVRIGGNMPMPYFARLVGGPPPATTLLGGIMVSATPSPSAGHP